MCHPGLDPGLGLGDVIRDSIETIDGVLKGTMDSIIMSYWC